MYFNKMGVMLDCSRNAVRNVDTLKKFIDYLSQMNFNVLQIYTENTFCVENEPYFGYLRGSYTEEELKEIDSYCISKGIELIPCIQTSAHLGLLKRFEDYSSHFDCENILLCGDERVYELIENIFKTLSKVFTSRKVNIGMDEANLIGRGKYLDINGYKDNFSVLEEHLQRILKIAKKYGFTPIMWSDMFFRLASGGNYYEENTVFSKENLKKVPENIDLIYWDYYSTEKQHYDKMIEAHKQMKNNIWFAGGAWTWCGYTPHNGYSIKSIDASINSCIEHKIQDIMLTMWGDGGSDCSIFSVLPSLFYFSQIAKGEKNINNIKNNFKIMTGIDWDDFLCLDNLDIMYNEDKEKLEPYSKTLLFNDLFLGQYDRSIENLPTEKYNEYSSSLLKFTKNESFGYIFDVQKSLSDVLFVKSKLGIKTRLFYKQKNLGQLEKLLPEYDELILSLKEFYKKYRVLWRKENKGNGFEFQDIKIGGLILRTEDCKMTIQEYISGCISKISELDEEIKEIKCSNSEWKYLVTTGYIDNNY